MIERAWRYVWAAPGTLIGLLLSPLFRKRSVSRGVLLCEGASWPRRLGWRYNAITFGHVVLCVDDEIDRDVFSHERVHVHQYERYGPMFLPAYVLHTVLAAARGRHYYRDNRFEIAARLESKGK